jgi:Ion channel
VAAGSVLFAGHFLEVPLGFHLCSGRGRAPGTDLIYFALGNYTTLGYSDVLPLEHWRCSAR